MTKIENATKNRVIKTDGQKLNKNIIELRHLREPGLSEIELTTRTLMLSDKYIPEKTHWQMSEIRTLRDAFLTQDNIKIAAAVRELRTRDKTTPVDLETRKLQEIGDVFRRNPHADAVTISLMIRNVKAKYGDFSG